MKKLLTTLTRPFGKPTVSHALADLERASGRLSAVIDAEVAECKTLAAIVEEATARMEASAKEQARAQRVMGKLTELLS